MARVHTLSSEAVHEAVHGGRAVALRREILRLDDPGEPPLAVERTHRPEGPSRPAVILVHGFAQNRATWRVSERSFQARLAEEGFDVWNLELRGHGRSRELGAGNARSFDEYVRDVCRAVDAAGGRPFLVGHSLGVAACVGAVTRVPAAGLVNLAGVFTFARDNRTLRALARWSLAWEPVLTRAPIRMHTGWAGALIARLYALTEIAGHVAPIAGWTPGSIERHLLAERLVGGFDWTSVEVWLQMCRWARGEPLQWASAFSQVDLPLLVVVGDHDPLVTEVDARACYEASGSADRELWVVDAWSHRRHWGHLDLILGHTAPAEVWPRVVRWLHARCP